MTTPPDQNDNSGLPLAFATFLIWGLMPLYLMLVKAVPPVEFVGWRIVFTLPICLALVLVMRQTANLRAALAWPVLRLLLLSSVMIAINWLVYTVAIQTGHVLATAIGYYMNPLANVLAGTLFLGERLSRRRWRWWRLGYRCWRGMRSIRWGSAWRWPDRSAPMA